MAHRALGQISPNTLVQLWPVHGSDIVGNLPGLHLPATTVTAAYTATRVDHLIRVDTTSGGLTVTLPEANLVLGMLIIVKKISADGNNVTVARMGTDTIDGAVSKVWSTQYTAFRFFAAANNTWDVL